MGHHNHTDREGPQTTRLSRSGCRWRMTAKGHEERFPPPSLSAGCGFRKETIAGMRRKGRDAPIAAVRRTTCERQGSTLS
jgi:hypothetical protein